MEDTKSNNSVDERFENFKKEYEELSKKYGFDFQPTPQYMQTTQGFFVTVCVPQVVDLKKDVVSPIQIMKEE